ncbi:MAG: GTP cyclohydrolase IIa [Candidatus Jordarchaeum sp.]|uniref:GTP cyclohydrolase IIa n=1 Tax=Candidatus Jordarchaeum sp. TaxID=2823881 RepID=UPI00404A99C4
MIQLTLIQLDNYGPWTELLGEDRESDLQIMQADIYADLQRMFALRRGLVFFNRFDNMIAVSNGVSVKDHEMILRSVGRRYPVSISMGIGSAESPFDAQVLATKALQEIGSAQSETRKSIIAHRTNDNGEQEYVQIAHIDINGFTLRVTDRESAYQSTYVVYSSTAILMRMFADKGALLFFNGGDNFVSVCNGLKKSDFKEIFDRFETSMNLKLKAGIGFGRTALDALSRANEGLSLIREKKTDEVIILKEEML